METNRKIIKLECLNCNNIFIFYKLHTNYSYCKKKYRLNFVTCILILFYNI